MGSPKAGSPSGQAGSRAGPAGGLGCRDIRVLGLWKNSLHWVTPARNPCRVLPELGGSRAVPGEILTLWMGHTIPGSAQGFLPAPPLSSSRHSGILPESQALQRAATSPGTRGHVGVVDFWGSFPAFGNVCCCGDGFCQATSSSSPSSSSSSLVEGLSGWKHHRGARRCHLVPLQRPS